MNQIIEIQYFGCICFYIEAIRNKYLILEQYENYQKMSYRNRCEVLGLGKVINLTVPIVGGRDQKQLVTTVMIDNGQPWQMQHWRTIESCYNKSAFFLHYKEDLKSVIFAPYDSLMQLCVATIQWSLQKLKAAVLIGYTDTFNKTVGGDCIDLRNRFKPSNRIQQMLTPYQQVFQQPFENNLCILDLLFNMGPQSSAYLTQQTLTA